MYEPKEFGGNGGSGGGSTSDLRCTFSTTQGGGKGGKTFKFKNILITDITFL